MKKYFIILAVAIIFMLFIGYFYFNKFNVNDEIDYSSDRVSTEIENTSILNNTVTSNNIYEQISKFSTKIIDKDNNRDINIKLTCDKINGTIIKNGSEFSFNKIAGNPTPDRGYKKAGIIVNGELTKGYGGGNCQVSTTIYNAVNKIEGIKVTERHKHGIELGYIKNGNDSTVAYDDLDFKFENNTGYDIKLYATSNKSNVTVIVAKIIND